jgi:site-specific DNA-methyltransferase (adenine-specific)
MIFCDLPYGTTQNKWDVIIPFEDIWRSFERIIKKDGAIVLTATQPFTSLLVASNLRLFKYSWVWEKSLKTNFLNAKKQPLRQHEDVLVFYAKQPRYNPQGLVPGSVSGGNKLTGSYGAWTPGESKQEMTGYPTSVLKIPNPNQGNIHPTQKPVSLVEYFIRTYTEPGEVVLDACMGSGSTAVAAINTRRRFIGFEIDQKMHELSARRLVEIVDGQTPPES